VGPRVGLDGCEVENNSCPTENRTPNPSARDGSLCLSRNPAPEQKGMFGYSEGNRAWEFGTNGFQMWLQPRNDLKPSHIMQVIHQSVSRICN